MNSPLMLVIWYKDKPPTGNVQKLKTIESPKKSEHEYEVGDYVKARCKGYGTQPGVIGKICDESQKSEMVKLINGDQFGFLVETILLSNRGHPTEEDTEPSGHERELEAAEAAPIQQKVTQEPSGHERELEAAEAAPIQQKVTQVEKSKEKKRKLEASKVKTDEPKIARIEQRRQDKLIQSQKDSANKRASEKLLESAQSTHMDGIAATLAIVVNEQQHLKSTMREMMTKLNDIAAMATCPKCVKALYKDCRIPKQVLSPTTQTLSPPITKFLTSLQQSPEPAVTQFVPAIKQSLVPTETSFETAFQQPTVIAATDRDDVCVIIDADRDSAADEDSSTKVDDSDHHEIITNISSDLVYLGEARYGIKILKQHLHSARVTSKDAVKYALNLLEFLVTRAECKLKLTLYGEGRGTRAMQSHKVLALQSEIFSLFYTKETTERKQEIWKKEIVLSINNKIRGIRNGKYPSVPE